MGIPLLREREFERVIMVEVLIGEMFRAEGSRPKDTKRAVVIDSQPTKTTNEDAHESERRSARINSLTEPTLLEMSGNATNQDLSFLYLFIREWNLQEPGPSCN